MSEAASQQRAQRPSLRAVALLPARLGSTRLARKMLLADTGLPLIVHTARNVGRAGSLQDVVIATDSTEVEQAAQAEGCRVLLTSPDHPSGTDRVLEAYEELCRAGEPAYDVVVNVQGDEPHVDPNDLDRLVGAFADPDVRAATLCGPLAPEDLARDSVVKVVRDARGDALYFSRSPIPSASHAREGAPADVARRHVGVYAYRPEALARFCALPVGALEKAENLEQLRWLEAGERMRVLETQHVPRGIDTRSDYEEFVAQCAAKKSVESTETR